MDPTTKKWIILGIVGGVIIIGAIIAIVLVLKKEPGDDGDGNGGDNGNGNGNGDEGEKYDIISPWHDWIGNEGDIIKEADEKLVAKCLERNEELNEEGNDLLEFSWSTVSQREQARDNDPTFPPCLMWPEGLYVAPGGDTNNHTYMFRQSQEGIDLNKWNVHLGVQAPGPAPVPSLEKTLDECANYIEDEGYPTFVYNFKDRKCFPKEEITPKFPWGTGNYYPGALFVPKQSTYDFVSTEGTTCGDMGMNYVNSNLECQDAAEELGLKSVEVGSISSVDRPFGCFWNTRDNPNDGGGLNLASRGRTGTQIKYETTDTNPTGASRLQICKRR